LTVEIVVAPMKFQMTNLIVLLARMEGAEKKVVDVVEEQQVFFVVAEIVVD
jgi:hypothetical protein